MKRTTVTKEGFFGIYHEADQPVDRKKVVIVLGGSEGNEKIPMEVGRMFADRGISAMGISNWKSEKTCRNDENVDRSGTLTYGAKQRKLLWLKFIGGVENV